MTNFEKTMPDASMCIHKMAESTRSPICFSLDQRIMAGEHLMREMPTDTLEEMIMQDADLIVEGLQGRGDYANKIDEFLAEKVFDFYYDDVDSHFFHTHVELEPEEIEIGVVSCMGDVIMPAMRLHAIMFPNHLTHTIRSRHVSIK